jgi:hypothetical protein
MKPKSQESSGQNDLFLIRLADLDPRHELYRLETIWKFRYSKGTSKNT